MSNLIRSKFVVETIQNDILFVNLLFKITFIKKGPGEGWLINIIIKVWK